MSTTLLLGIGLGGGLGVGLWALAVWLLPPRPALAAVLSRTTAPAPDPILTATTTRWTRLGRPLVAPLHAVGLPTPGIARDLVVLERGVDDFLAEKAVLALAGVLAPTIGTAALTAVGAAVDLPISLALTIGCAAVGFVLPDLTVHRKAAERRAELRTALSTFLDLVVISLAGGAGVDSALTDSAAIGRGWAFTQLQRTLATARLTRTTPWTTLRQLGHELDITELTELAASVSLSGTEGAKVRQSLTAKANALRARQLTDAEKAANAATERLSLPVMVLFLGFLVFIAYPAIHQVLNGL